MQKKKVRKLAIAHFGLSVCIGLFLFYYAPTGYSGERVHPRHNEWVVWHDAWCQLLAICFFVLQPQFLLIVLVNLIQLYGESHFLKGVTCYFAFPSIFFFMLIALNLFLIPVWSYYFSRLFIKLDNWLNHFPILGKKVF